ncbi:MAG TPA: M20/M25/M40 family metallo-hydrolase [Gemmatimonadales bacterium]|nr:M20/M25/M40 family metallo-hydrolase [Gemmatimonadales bacterium]
MSTVRGVALVAALLAAACARAPTAAGVRPAVRAPAAPLSADSAGALLGALADDSMEGRGTATRGGDRAARFIADRMREYGLVPAGDSGYFQRVPLEASTDSTGRRMLALVTSAELPEATVRAVNVVGLVRGADPALRGQAVLIDAHYDHLGIGTPVAGDSIYNGADDDASGVVAVLGAARALAGGPPPRRTVVFLATTGEELGLLGTHWYLAHPVVPLDSTVANLEFEMIGRPDSLAGGPGKGWLTGYERSTMGERLAAAGIPVVPDPRPEEQFFLRSDNIAFARRGIPAHTLSSYNMHADYHTPADEADRIDDAHLARLVDAAARAARLLADGEPPAWKPGGRPVPPSP